MGMICGQSLHLAANALLLLKQLMRLSLWPAAERGCFCDFHTISLLGMALPGFQPQRAWQSPQPDAHNALAQSLQSPRQLSPELSVSGGPGQDLACAIHCGSRVILSPKS